MSKITFTQYLLPNGCKREEYFDAPDEISEIAASFIKAGGWYECEVLNDRITVSFTACMNTDDGPQDVAIELCQNGPDVPKAVEKLVRASVMQLYDK